ncbi:putative mediator of RNA polymerase II transcription subunit 26 isoform X2 [Nilaparvata lugens]|uniref:putative mediator of RNA polymerase II transcription subunit 26 isoform X2 n=2 Tax=Nilaparvata lugens TaxID=108931 RepID=UPI00193E9265|nr:putative mediator of RNA polymerase II transcription subunit 26 isoform X2 [Nilaparvata lugens]
MNVLCLKLRARRTWVPSPPPPNIPTTKPAPGLANRMTISRHKQTENMSPPLQITEDTPPDMLAGSMDLCVVLPNGKDVRMSVERSTPMMDLLVQVTTANKISPAGHVIQAIGERGVMPYKPSTPIGALDTWTIYIVPKNQVGQIAGRKGYYKSVNQPFEQTFRLQVHLPRNQLYVSRISPKTRVSEILRQVCSEKNLDPSKYSLRHPVNLDQVLAGSCSLADYKLQEVALVSNRSRPVSGVSTVDIMALQQQRPVHATANHRSCEGSLSSGSLGGRSLSPTRSDESSASPPPLVPPVPHRPLRKRRPAPKPPVNNNNNLNNTVNNVVNKNNNNINSNPAVEASQPSQGATVICHSRNSSDSSGYHEASVLSESPESTNNSLPDSLPRRSKLPSNESNLESTSNVKSGGALSRSLSNLTTAVNSAVPRSIKTHSTSSTSLIAIGRKKKAAPAPPMARPLKMSSVSEERQKDISSPQSPLDDTSRKSSTLPATLRSTLHPQHSDVGSSSSSVCTPDTVDDLPAPSHLCPSFDLLQNTPSELPKPKPRTIFETADCVDDGDGDDAASSVLSSSSSVDLVGDGCSDSTNSTICSQVVNKPKPVRSRKKRPAPLPKPRSSQSVVVSTSTEPLNNVVNNRLAMDDDVSDSQQTNKIGNSQETVRVNGVDPIINCESVAKTDTRHDSLGENKSTCEKEVGKVDSGNVDDPVDVCKDCLISAVANESMSSECQEVFQIQEEVCPPDKVISVTASSLSVPTSSTPNVKKVKSSLSEDGLVENSSRNSEMLPDEKGRNFSVGNLNEVADFPKTQLGRWPNAECLPECSSLACANTEADTETKTESSTSDLRMDDEEIDRIFQNAMRDHTSLESGMGDEEGVALTLTEVTLPPPSPTQRPFESGPESLDWEYRLPAPPTFRDETSSPVMTVFDTVTIGNLTDVFRPPEPDLVNVDSPKDHNQDTSKLVNKHNKTVQEIVANKLNDNNEDKVGGLVNEIVANKLNDNNQDKVGCLLEQSAKPDLIKHVEQEKVRSNDVILNGDMENKENLRVVQDKVHVDRSEKKTKVEGDNICRLIDNSQKPKQPDVRGNVLDNFVIMTYQESGGKKPVEVFEDDSVTSSAAVNEKKSETRENSVFRIPKSVPRRFEPRLARRSSFGSEDKRSKAGPATVKRSASHVSLLAGNVARGHLSRSNGEPYIRNINSELNIAQGDEEKSKLADWRNSGSVGLQSLQVLRSILPQLNNSHDSINADNDDYIDNRNPDIRVASDLHDKFERSHSEEVSSSERYALHAAPAPAVSFATWNERPKRQVSIKTDRDYCYGINKLKSHAFDQRDTTEPKQSVVNFSSDMRHNDLDKPDIIKHSSADLSHVPVVRAVELKKKPYFSSSCVDVTDLGRCGFFHGRSYENLSCLDNSATFSKSSTLKPTAVSSKESFKSQQSVSTEEEASSYSGVNSLLRKFGQQKPTSTNRPVSCYLYGSGAYNNNKLEENSVPRQTTGNTSRVMLNSDKRFTSVVGINNDEAGSNSVPRKEFTSQYEKPTSRVMVNGTSHNDDRFVNNSKDVKNAVNSSLEFIKAQSKISSGGFVLESPTRKIETDIPVAQSTTSPPPTAVPAKSILKPSKVNKPQSSGGIPPPPPVMPTLKPVGERRQTRTLPRVETDPRDQLLESIRNFGGLKSLKKSSSK